MVSIVAKMGKRMWTSASVRSLLAKSDTSDPVEAMRARAAALIAQCEFERPPINHEMVASFRGIEAVQPIEMKQAGLLVPIGPGQFHVFVNARDSKGRQRFSCDHEVSHTFFPNYGENPIEKTDMYIGEYQEDAEEEYLCDVGAAELLMPRRFFHPALRDMGCSIEVISELARVYEASQEAVAVQMVQAAVHECALIVWHMAHKPTQASAVNPAQGFLDGIGDWAGTPKKLRTRYARATPGITDFFPPHKSVHEDSPILHCYLSGEACKGEAMISTGRTCKRFYTESMFVPPAAGDNMENGKVITLVLPQKPILME